MHCRCQNIMWYSFSEKVILYRIGCAASKKVKHSADSTQYYKYQVSIAGCMHKIYEN